MMGFLRSLLGSTESGEADPGAETSIRALPELPPAPTPTPVQAIARATPAPARATPPPARPLLRDDHPDFPSIFERAGVTEEQRRDVQKAQDLLKRLPSGASPVLKRQIVEAAFVAFDISTQDIVEAASAQIDALEGYLDEGQHTKQRLLDEGDARVRALQDQIAAVRAETARAVAAEEVREVAARTEIARVEPILTFFLHEQVGGPLLGEPASRDPRRPESMPPAGSSPSEESGPNRFAAGPGRTGEETVMVEVALESEGARAAEMRAVVVEEDDDDDAEELELDLDLDLDPDPDVPLDEELSSDTLDPREQLEVALAAAELQRQIEAEDDASRLSDEGDAPLVDDRPIIIVERSQGEDGGSPNEDARSLDEDDPSLIEDELPRADAERAPVGEERPLVEEEGPLVEEEGPLVEEDPDDDERTLVEDEHRAFGGPRRRLETER